MYYSDPDIDKYKDNPDMIRPWFRVWQSYERWHGTDVQGTPIDRHGITYETIDPETETWEPYQQPDWHLHRLLKDIQRCAPEKLEKVVKSIIDNGLIVSYVIKEELVRKKVHKKQSA
jgi:hypothetical protein